MKLKQLRRLWFVPFMLLAMALLVAASPTPRKILSESFSDWIRVYGDNPEIHMDRENDTGSFFSIIRWRDYNNDTDFWIGCPGLDEDHYHWQVRGPGGATAISVDTDSDVGIKGVPGAGIELDVSGDAKVSGSLGIGCAPSGTWPLEVAGDIFVGSTGDVIVDNGKLETDVIEARDSDGLTVKKSDGSTIMYIDDDGCIGINDSSPYCASYDLEVAGNANVDGAFFAGSTEVSELHVSWSTFMDGDTHVGSDFYHGYYDGAFDSELATHATGYISVQGGRRFDTDGDAQAERFTMSRVTELNGTGWYDLYVVRSLTNYATIPSDTIWHFDISLVVLEDGAGTGAAYTITGVIINDGGAVTLETSTVTTVFEDDSTWDAQVAMSGTNMQVQIKDTDGPGSGGDDVRAVALVELTEVSHP